MRAKKAFLYLFWVLFISIIFNRYAYDINQVNANIRVLVRTGTFSIREFTKEGLPISYSPRIGEYQSPFYVVHYAIYYSENMRDDNKGYHWRNDPSLKYWNVPPDIKDIEESKLKFKSCVDWLVDNLQYDNYGNSHFFYNFDWKYNGYPNGGLRAPWWSGLTDAYAIIPLLRAYDLFKDIKYLNAAEELYYSSTTSFKEGGSLTTLSNGDLWIEEYADPRVKNINNLAFVFNGMVYSTYGIKSYERYVNKNRYSNQLTRSILRNVSQFNKNGWSNYDLLGTPSNIKYHKIHSALLEDLITNISAINSSKDIKIGTLKELAGYWDTTSKKFPGLYYIMYGPRGVSYFHFLFIFFLVLSLPHLLYRVVYLRVIKK